MKNLFLIILLSIMASSFSLFASSVVSGDSDYYYINKNGYTYIFPDEYKGLLEKVIPLNEELKTVYQKDYSWKLDGQVPLILGSSKNQIANGFATIYPYPLTTFYGEGASAIDMFAEQSWLSGLIIHESAHLYQLNAKQGLAKYAKNIFGNSILVAPVPPLYVLTSPNMFLPTWIIEGNAVFNESRFGNGGRLYSGEQRALFYALLKKGLLNENRLINNHIEFAAGAEKYIVGGYFNLYLAQKYGIKKTNSFFLNHGNRYWNPFRLDLSFRNSFNVKYITAVDSFLSKYMQVAKKQKSSTAPQIIRSMRVGPMSSTRNKVYFLSMTTSKEYPILVEVDKKTKVIKKRPANLPRGKVFKINNKFYSAASGNLNNSEIVFGLWDESDNLLKGSHSKIMLDIKNNKELYFDAKNSYFVPTLHKDNQFVTNTNSSALFDDNLNFYYFKQNGKERTLYKNKKPILAFKGYYGKVVDIVKNNVYFIASTKYGSSLFVHNGKDIFRASKLDTIVDAKVINDNEFLISEVTGHGYEYKFIKNEHSYYNKLPNEYSYFFEKHHNFNMMNRLKIINSSTKSDSKIYKNKKAYYSNKKKYGPLNNMKFSHWTFSYMYSNLKNRYITSALFTDPIMQNSLSILIDEEVKKDDIVNNVKEQDDYSIIYNNSKHKLSWTYALNYTRYEEYKAGTIGITDIIINKSPELKSILSLKYPIWEKNDYSFSTQLSSEVDHRENNKTNNIIRLDLKNEKIFSMSLVPYRSFGISNQIELNEKNKSTTNSSHLYGFYDIINENIIAADVEYIKSDDLEIQTNNTYLPVPHNEFYRYNLDNKSYTRIGSSIQKVFNRGIYFSTFPISIRRVSPTVFANRHIYNSQKYNSYGIGVLTEGLLGHLMPYKALIKYTTSDDNGDNFGLTLTSFF